MNRILVIVLAILSIAWVGVSLSRGLFHGTHNVAALIQPVQGAPEATRSLRQLVSQYEAEPTPDAAVAVWDSFSEVGERIATLKKRVASTAGGVRAEAEIERIELQRIYDAELARFAAVHARLEAARAALDALATASDSADGIRAAATILVHGASPMGERRLRTAEGARWWRGIGEL